MISYKTSCRSCGHKILQEVVDLGEQKIQGSFVYKDKPAPPSRAVKGIIVRCQQESGGCGLVQNWMSISPDILYSNYGYRSSISQTMRNHLVDIATEAISLFGDEPITKTVLDIGANDLFLLKQFSDNWTRVGIDPCDIINQVEKENIAVFNECYPHERLKGYKGRFSVITTIACFYDMDDPVDFCSNIKYHLSDQGVWIVEFAYLPAVLNNLAYDGMVHEHLCLYSLSSFKHIIDRVGLKIIKAFENDTNSGSLQVWLTHKRNAKFDSSEDKERIQKILIKEFDAKLDTADPYRSFANKIFTHKNDLYSHLKHFKGLGYIIHAYGMSTKLNTILQYCNIGPELIEAAADRDPNKWGAKTLNGIPIISEEESRKTAKVYLVGPYHFKNEILQREEETIKRGVRFMFPLPRVEVI